MKTLFYIILGCVLLYVYGYAKAEYDLYNKFPIGTILIIHATLNPLSQLGYEHRLTDTTR